MSVFTIRLPPLRERGDDLPMLVNYYLRRFSRELARDLREVAPAAIQRLRAHFWPGNLVVKQGQLQATGTVLIPAFLPELSSDGSQAVATASSDKEPSFRFEDFIRQRLESDSANVHGEAHLELDLILVQAALRFTDGKQHKAAKVLGLARGTFRLRLRELGITVTKNIREEDEDAG